MEVLGFITLSTGLIFVIAVSFLCLGSVMQILTLIMLVLMSVTITQSAGIWNCMESK